MEHSTTPSVNLCTNIFFKIFGFKSCYISLSKKVVNSSRERGVIIEWTCSSRKKILGKMHDSRHQAFIWSKLLATTSVFDKKKQAIPASLRQIKHNFKIRNHYLSRIFYIAKMALGSTHHGIVLSIVFWFNNCQLTFKIIKIGKNLGRNGKTIGF